MRRVIYCDSSRTRSRHRFVQNVYYDISPQLRYLPLVPHQRDHPLELTKHGRVMVQPEFEEFDWEFIWSHRLRVRYRSQGCGYLVFCRFDPESICDRLLGNSSSDVESDFIRFHVEKGAEEPCPPFDNKPWVSQLPSLFVTDVLRTNLSRVFYTQELEALDRPLCLRWRNFCSRP